MKDFLEEYIGSLSERRRTRVHEMLAAAKVDKGNLDSLAGKIRDRKTVAPISIVPEDFNGTISADKIAGVYRDAIDRMNSVFEVLNEVSLLLDTHTSVMTSEIKGVEDEVDALSKQMQNYAFMLSDNGAYDFAYLETFNDDVMRSEEDIQTVTDRSGVNFRHDEQAYVNSASGVLTLSPTLETSHAMTGQITSGNCLNFITSDTGIKNALNGMVGNGWRVAVGSARPISSVINNVSSQGAQLEIELSVTTPSPSDCLVLTPFAEKPFEVKKIELLFPVTESGAQESEVILDQTTLIDKPTDFGFALNTVSGVRITINQPVYNRGKNPPLPSEERHRKLYTAVVNPPAAEALPELSGVFRRNRKALMRTLTTTLNRTMMSKDVRIFKGQAPMINFDPMKGPMNANDFVKNNRRNYGQEGIWKSSSQINLMFRKMVQDKMLSSVPEASSGRWIIENKPLFKVGGAELASAIQGSKANQNVTEARFITSLDAEALSASAEDRQFLKYEYDLGFRNIQIGRGIRVFRGAFVSKTLPAPSDSGEVKIKVDDTDYSFARTDRDLAQVTSIEYSVTNKSEPKLESDWIPILPINKNQQVIAERIFFEENGTCRFRFPADRQNDLKVYKNGFIVSADQISWTESLDNQSFVGFRLPVGTLFPNDIYTVSYAVYGNHQTINFGDRGFEINTLSQAYDEQGAGQTFYGTYNGRSITLNWEPWVDNNQVDTFGGYSETLGFTGTYQPITIVLSDGTVALNQTNYKGLYQNDLSTFDETKTAFIHSGRNITFNKAIEGSFTVYYQYLPSNLKFRTVLRVNNVSYVSPSVSSVQIKTKTKKANAKKVL